MESTVENGQNIKPEECTHGECPSDFSIECYQLDELSPMDKLVVQRAVENCAGCAQRLAVLSTGFSGLPDIDAMALQTEILARAGDAELPTELVDALGQTSDENGPQSFWSKLSDWLFNRGGRLVVVAAATIVMALILVPKSKSPVQNDLGVRLKGTLKLVVHRARGNDISQVQSGEIFKAGDRLRFEVTVAKAGHIMILGREASGTTYVAYPLDKKVASTPIEAGRLELPGSVKLDASLGRETLYAVFCADAFTQSQVSIEDKSAQGPTGCVSELFEMVKSK